MLNVHCQSSWETLVLIQTLLDKPVPSWRAGPVQSLLLGCTEERRATLIQHPLSKLSEYNYENTWGGTFVHFPGKCKSFEAYDLSCHHR